MHYTLCVLHYCTHTRCIGQIWRHFFLLHFHEIFLCNGVTTSAIKKLIFFSLLFPFVKFRSIQFHLKAHSQHTSATIYKFFTSKCYKWLFFSCSLSLVQFEICSIKKMQTIHNNFKPTTNVESWILIRQFWSKPKAIFSRSLNTDAYLYRELTESRKKRSNPEVVFLLCVQCMSMILRNFFFRFSFFVGFFPLACQVILILC